MSLPYVDDVALQENIVKTKEHVESVRATLDSAKQNVIEYATIPSPSADVLGLFVIYTGATNSTYTHGYVYECVSDGAEPATYSWVQRNVQEGVAVDGETIIKDASTDEISAVTATNLTKGIVKGSADVSIDADGAMTVNDRVKEVNALPTATVDLLDECYLLRSTQTGYDLGKIYQCQAVEVVPEGTEDPSALGWYELVGTTYELSADTSVDSSKTYYEIKWVSISSANLVAGKGITIEDNTINADTNIFPGTLNEWNALTSAEQENYDFIASPDEASGKTIFANNAGAHNSIYRGKYLGSSVTAEQYAQISAGTFEDLFIGDYWTIGGVNYRIAHFDYWLRTGSTVCTEHHVVVVPDTNFEAQKMNDTNVTTGGYVGSKMYTTYLATARSTITTAFGSSHILSHNVLFTKAATDGKASSWDWYDSTVDLMNECMVYGHNSWGSHPGYETGVDKSQLALFSLMTEFICNNEPWRLRDVVSTTGFALVDGNGGASRDHASYPYGVRPAFAIIA